MTRYYSETLNELLRDPRVAAGYLNDALDEGNPAVIQMALNNIAEAQEGGVSGLIARSQLTSDSVRAALSDTGDSHLACLAKIVQGLGLRLKAEA